MYGYTQNVQLIFANTRICEPFGFVSRGWQRSSSHKHIMLEYLTKMSDYHHEQSFGFVAVAVDIAVVPFLLLIPTSICLRHDFVAM